MAKKVEGRPSADSYEGGSRVQRVLQVTLCVALGFGMVLGAALMVGVVAEKVDARPAPAAASGLSGQGETVTSWLTGTVEITHTFDNSTLSALMQTSPALSALVSATPEAPPQPAGVPLCVNPGGSGGCYAKIQDAIDAANAGDSINVAAGTYTEHITMTDRVSIYGQGLDNTIIDGGYAIERATVYIQPGVSASTVLSGVQVTGGGNGTASSTTFNDGGGIAIWYASPTIQNTRVFSSTARNGGGVFVRSGSPTFNNVQAWSNRAGQHGGGFYVDGNGEVTIIGNPFEGFNGTILLNSADWDGGGIYTYGITTTLAGLRIMANSATYGGGVGISSGSNRVTLTLNDVSFNSATTIGYGGGGIHVSNASDLLILANVFNSNTSAGGGGAAIFSQAAGIVQTNFFVSNTATGSGGGVAVVSSSGGLKLLGNWFEANSGGDGGGLSLFTGAPQLVDANTFVSNTAGIGGGIYLYQSGPVSITNNIVARNTAGGAGGGVVIIESPGRLINNTIAENTSDGVWFSQAEGALVVNNVISLNSGDGIELYTLQGPTNDYTADYNDLYQNGAKQYEGLPPGPNDMATNPKFVGSGPDLAAYYHIQPSSPISTTGSFNWAPARDIDGELRILGGSVSMGADEIPFAEYRLYLPLTIRNYQ